MSSSYNEMISKFVRFFLRKWPITEGKKQIVKVFEKYSVPYHRPLVISKMKNGFDLFLNIRNPEHARMFLYGEHDERYEVNLLRKIILKDDVIWDVGANIGFYSMLFSKLALMEASFPLNPSKGPENT